MTLRPCHILTAVVLVVILMVGCSAAAAPVGNSGHTPKVTSGVGT